MTHNLDDMLSNLREDPRPERFEQLLAIYLDKKTSHEERQTIRKGVKPVAGKLTGSALAGFWAKLRNGQPEKFIRTSLGQMSMCDGWPDPRDDRMSLDYLKEYAREHRIDIMPYIDAAKKVSTERIQKLLDGHLHLNLWSDE